MKIDTTCNATLDNLRIGASEIPIAGSLTFHNLAIIIAAACTFIAIILSFWLISMHAMHYTNPYEQRHIIRILFMIPVYAVASFLALWFYWHAIYFDVISECYEAFAIASFFALLCHYLAPDLHEQKEFFRGITPKPWIMPVNYFKKCCGGERGIWRTPRSGLTWFNIIWSGIYQYCFIRVTMTITAVVTQYFGRYCESSNSPVFAHIWVLVIESIAVSIAMYCIFQFYLQLREELAPHHAFLKVLAIKLVIFLSFWQSFGISILTSSALKIVEPTSKFAYPDIQIGIPSLLLCIEMAIFAVLHLFAFPYKPYTKEAMATKDPLSPISIDPGRDKMVINQGGFLGYRALVDAMNPWDLVKGFARGMRWLFVGRKHREDDLSYKNSNVARTEDGLSLQPTRLKDERYNDTSNLPIANEFRRSKFLMPSQDRTFQSEEGEGLIAHAQPNPLNGGSGYTPSRPRFDSNGQDIASGGTSYPGSALGSPDRLTAINPSPGTVRRQERDHEIGLAVGGDSNYYSSQIPQDPSTLQPQSQAYLEQKRQQRREQQQRPSEQWAESQQPTRPPAADSAPVIHNALWGPGPQP